MADNVVAQFSPDFEPQLRLNGFIQFKSLKSKVSFKGLRLKKILELRLFLRDLDLNNLRTSSSFSLRLRNQI